MLVIKIHIRRKLSLRRGGDPLVSAPEIRPRGLRANLAVVF